MAGTPTIEALLAEWIAAFNSADLDKHMACYTPDATLFGSTDELQVGREAVRTYFAGRGPDVKVARYGMPLVRHVTPDVASTAGHVDFTNGGEAMPYRMTWLLVRSDGNWQIAQHHGSPRRGN